MMPTSKRDGHLGRDIVHFSRDGSDFCQDAMAYVEYCNSHPEAYRDVKLEGAKLGLAKQQQNNKGGGGGPPPHVVYKMHKHKVVRDIMEKAKKWQRETLSSSSST